MRGRVSAAVCFACAVSILTVQAGGRFCFAQEAQEKKISRVAVLTYSFSSEYWGYVTQGCMAWDKSDPTIEAEMESVSSSIAAQEQAEKLEADLESGRFDGYVIAAIDKPLIEEILSGASVPVVAIDSPFAAGCVIGSIGTDNVTAAAAGGKKAVDMAKSRGAEKPECVMIGSLEDDPNHIGRMDGFRSGVEEAGGIWLDRVYPTDKTAASGTAAMKKIMKDYPDGVEIVACYNDVLAESALDSSWGNDAFSDTVFIGFDGNGSVCDRIMKDDRYENMITVAQNPYEMGFHALEMISQYYARMDAGDAADGDSAAAGEKKGNETPAAAGKADGKESGKADGKEGGKADGKESGKADEKAAGADNRPDAAGGDTESSGKNEIPFVDSGYSVITRVNVQERLIQIENHLTG